MDQVTIMASYLVVTLGQGRTLQPCKGSMSALLRERVRSALHGCNLLERREIMAGWRVRLEVLTVWQMARLNQVLIQWTTPCACRLQRSARREFPYSPFPHSFLNRGPTTHPPPISPKIVLTDATHQSVGQTSTRLLIVSPCPLLSSSLNRGSHTSYF